MPLSKFEANPMLRRGVKRASFSLFTLASSCSNAYFRAYAIIDFLTDPLVFLNTVTYISIYYIPPPLTVHFSMTRSVRYQPIFNTLYYTLHTEHAYCLSYRF